MLDDSRNSPKFPPTKITRYTAYAPDAVDPWKHASCSRSDRQQIHGTCRQAADHSNRAYGSTGSGLVVTAVQAVAQGLC